MANELRAFHPTIPALIPFHGEYEYTGWKDEQESWKTTCAIGDWSFLPKLRVWGPDALRFFSEQMVNGFDAFAIGQAKHAVQCNVDGKVVTDGVLLRRGEEEFEFQAGRPHYALYLLATGNYDAQFEWVTGFNFQISGPNALALMEALTRDPLRDIKFMHTKLLRLDGELSTVSDQRVNAIRMGMSGEVGFELQGRMEDAEAVYEAIMTAGREFGLRRVGKRTVMLNHTEACFPTGRLHYVGSVEDARFADYRCYLVENQIAGSGLTANKFNTTVTVRGSFESDDIRDYYRSPIEMGWRNRINLKHDFVGRAALEEELKAPPRQVVTMEFNSDDVIEIYASLFGEQPTMDLMEIPHPIHQVGWVDRIERDGKLIGHSCFPGYSHHFRKMLSLGFIATEHAEPGTKVNILWGNPGTRQKHIRAVVRPAPYKTERSKIDLTAV